ILEAWDDISAEMIIKTSKKCGISNRLDGTGDDLFYSFDKEKSEVDNNEDLLEIVKKNSLSADELELENEEESLPGGANGIGAALARRLVLEGAQVVIGDIDKKSGQVLITELNQNNKTNAIFVFCDTTNFDLLHQLLDTAQNTFGGVDIVCNNAGIGQIDEFYDQNWIKIIDVNLNAVIKGTQLGIEFLKKRGGGVIINTAKYGVIGFTQSLRDLNNTDKIRVNAVAPGFVDTHLTQNIIKTPVVKFEKSIPFDEVVNAFIKIIKDDKFVGNTILIPKENLSQIISKSFLKLNTSKKTPNLAIFNNSHLSEYDVGILKQNTINSIGLHADNACQAVKVRSRVQRTSYKASEKLAKNNEEKYTNTISSWCWKSFVLPSCRRKLVIWLNELRQIGIAVTVVLVLPVFKTTHLFLRHHTKISQKLPEDLTDKIIEFHKFVIQSRLRYLSQIVNMDETLVYFIWQQLWQVVENYTYGVSNINKPLSLLVMDSFEEHKTDKILEAWDDISAEMIIKTSKKCGISNRLDGTGDDLFYSFDKEKSEVDNNEDLLEIVKKNSLSADELELENEFDESLFSHQDDCYYLSNYCHLENRGGHRYLRPSKCSKFVLKQGYHLFYNYDWTYSYHGTDPKNIKSILKYGLKKPGSLAGNDEVRTAHGSKYGPGIYTSKVPLYAQLYAPMIKWGDKYFQTIFMVRQKLNSINSQE
ncbi:21520_t:CDS:10, partial [Gigaspora rosea]